MSDNEVQNSSKHLETGSSSADESSASEAVKMSQVSEETRRQRQVRFFWVLVKTGVFMRG